MERPEDLNVAERRLGFKINFPKMREKKTYEEADGIIQWRQQRTLGFRTQMEGLSLMEGRHFLHC